MWLREEKAVVTRANNHKEHGSKVLSWKMNFRSQPWLGLQGSYFLKIQPFCFLQGSCLRCKATWEIKTNKQNWGFPGKEEVAWGGVLIVFGEVREDCLFSWLWKPKGGLCLPSSKINMFGILLWDTFFKLSHEDTCSNVHDIWLF